MSNCLVFEQAGIHSVYGNYSQDICACWNMIIVALCIRVEPHSGRRYIMYGASLLYPWGHVVDKIPTWGHTGGNIPSTPGGGGHMVVKIP